MSCGNRLDNGAGCDGGFDVCVKWSGVEVTISRNFFRKRFNESISGLRKYVVSLRKKNSQFFCVCVCCE